MKTALKTFVLTLALPLLAGAEQTGSRKGYTLDSGFKGYTVNMKPEDALSVLLAGLIEGLRYTPEGGTRNSDVLGAFLTQKTGSNAIPEFYNKLVALFSGDGAKFEPINWDYMLSPEEGLQADTNFALPPQTTEILTYLNYNNDWTKETTTSIPTK